MRHPRHTLVECEVAGLNLVSAKKPEGIDKVIEDPDCSQDDENYRQQDGEISDCS
jgi:hypothetical protein